MRKKLTRSISDRMIAGICGGLGEYLGIDSTIIRVIWAALAIVGGSGIILYILCWLIIPEEY